MSWGRNFGKDFPLAKRDTEARGVCSLSLSGAVFVHNAWNIGSQLATMKGAHLNTKLTR